MTNADSKTEIIDAILKNREIIKNRIHLKQFKEHLTKEEIKKLQKPITDKLDNITEFASLMKNEKNSALPHEATRNFRGVFAIDMLPKKIRKDESGIINFQPSNCYGSHWVCYINKPYLRNILYFDSFGISPPEKIKTYLLGSGKNIA
jgi:hypothetical protein